jgi:hypothetical protein
MPKLDPAGRNASLPSVEGLDEKAAAKALAGAGSSKGKNKAELLAEAQERGLAVSDSNTKAEIQAALDEAESSSE